MKLKARLLVGMLFALVVFTALAVSNDAPQVLRPAASAQVGRRPVPEGATGQLSASHTPGNAMIHASATSSGYVNISNSKDNSSNLGTMQITIPANRVLTEINFTVTRAASALEYYGQEHTSGASSYEINATETSLAQYFNITAYYVGFDSIWWYMRFPDAPADVLHVELWCPNGTNHPDVLASENVTNMDDFGATSWGWMEYALPEAFNITCLPTCLWAALNVSGLTANDVLVSHQADGAHDLGPAKTYTVGAWSEPVALAGRDLSCFLYGRRIDPATNGTWEAPSAEDCALSITVDSQTESFSGDEVGFTDLVDAVTIDVAFAANLSCDVELAWEMTLVNVSSEAEAVTTTRTINETVEPEKDYNSHPYIPDPSTFLENHGWHVLFIASIAAVMVAYGLFFKKNVKIGAIIGLIIISLFIGALSFAPGLVEPPTTFVGTTYDANIVFLQDRWAAAENWTAHRALIWDEYGASDQRWEDIRNHGWAQWHVWNHLWRFGYYDLCELSADWWNSTGTYYDGTIYALNSSWTNATNAWESIFGRYTWEVW